MQKITIEIPDESYELFYARAELMRKKAADISGDDFAMSAYDIIRSAAELGITPHINRTLDIMERNLQNRGAKDE